jgi:hypothetical protein
VRGMNRSHHGIGLPAPGMSRERFLRLLDAAEHLAAHIHEAPVWIVPCLEGGSPTRTSGSSIYPTHSEHVNGGERARPRGDIDDAVLAVLKGKRRPLSACRLTHTRMPCFRSAIRWGGAAQSAVFRSPMSSIKTGGISLIGICSDFGASRVIAETTASAFASLGYRPCRTGRHLGHHRHTPSYSRHFEANATAQALAHRKCDLNTTVVK